MQLRSRHNGRAVTAANKPAKNDEVRSFTELLPELQSEILVRLPVNSLLFCRCVCKSLRALISSPSFAQSHLNRINSLQKSLIMHLDWDKHLMLYSSTRNPNVSSLSLTPILPHIPEHQSHKIILVGCCNGLILIAVWLGTDLETDYTYYLLILWNPVINQHRYLPEPPFRYSGVHEFAYLPETNDYVVLKIAPDKLAVQLYKLSTDSWVTIDYESSCRGFVLKSEINSFMDIVFLNGTFHWVSTAIYEREIFYYNMKEQEPGVISSVDGSRLNYLGTGRSVDIKKLVVIDQSLAMIYYNYDGTFPLEIWVMNDYGIEASWTVRFLIYDNVYVNKFCYLEGYWTSGLMILNVQNDSKLGSKFMLYDVNSRSRMRIARMDDVCDMNSFCSFVETLVPVNKVDSLSC